QFAHELGPTLGVEPETSLLLLEQLLLDPAGGEQVDDHSLGVDPEQLDQVEDERSLVVVVGVEQADARVESGEEAGAVDEGIEDAIGVVEQAVEFVPGRRATAALEAE